MSLRINTNIPAMGALRNLAINEGEIAGSVMRLSSGLRINTAADDPAGLIISEGMRSQIEGIGMAIRNSQDAVNMSKTAEAALDEVQRLLRNIRGLAVQSANTGVADSAMLQANQAQIRSTIQSINRIADQTQWGTKKLLDGTAGAMANVTAVNDVSSIFVGGTWDGQSIVSGPVTMNRGTSAERAIATLLRTFASANAIVTTAGAFIVNGYSFTSDGTETLQTLVQKINAMSATTGVTAQINGSGPVSISLRSNDFGAQHSVEFFDPSNILHNASQISDAGVDAVFGVTVGTTAGARTVTLTGGRGPKESGLRLTDAFGNSFMLTENGNLGLSPAAQVGVVTAGSIRFQIGANANQSVAFSMPVVYANRLGSGVVPNNSLADIDVTTQSGATDAIRIIDAAITQLAQQRGELGSFQANFLESTVRSLSVAKENFTASESQIRDADIAAEMTDYTRVQILRQSGMSVLAQANQLPQGVLQLLRQ